MRFISYSFEGLCNADVANVAVTLGSSPWEFQEIRATWIIVIDVPIPKEAPSDDICIRWLTSYCLVISLLGALPCLSANPSPFWLFRFQNLTISPRAFSTSTIITSSLQHPHLQSTIIIRLGVSSSSNIVFERQRGLETFVH